MANYSVAEENYIKTIFHLEAEKGLVNTKLLADGLKTSAASVTDMLKKLAKKEIVSYKAYYGCQLTEKGRAAAVHIVRRHRLWEYFLYKHLGFNWKEVHDVAEELEHVGSEKLIEKLDAFLGCPRFDPHGDPIPDATGNMEENAAFCLADAVEHKKYQIVKVHHQSAEFLNLLQEKNISIGAILFLKKNIRFDNSLEVEIEHCMHSLSPKTAKNIFVKPV